MKLGTESLLVAISFAISLKLWKGESRITAFTKLSSYPMVALTTEFLSELFAVRMPLD
jgi:hypothetical protein